MKQVLGWHNLSNELVLFHAQLKQFLLEPAVDVERMRKDAVAMKRFIEEVIDVPGEVEGGGETEVRDLEQGDGIPPTDK